MLVRAYLNLPWKPRVILWSRLAPLCPGQTFYGNERVEKINKAIEKVAILEGVETVDMESPLKGHPEWIPDHLHPKAEGAPSIGEIMKEYLTSEK